MAITCIYVSVCVYIYIYIYICLAVGVVDVGAQRGSQHLRDVEGLGDTY